MVDRGSIAVAGARCGWALDGGALHLFGFSGDANAAALLLEQAERVAAEVRAAVCVATLLESDVWARALCAHNFEIDERERTVRAGSVVGELSLVRVVGESPYPG